MDYQETVHYLYQQLPAYQRIGKAAYKADLETTLKLDAYFKHPHLLYKTIHVAGTNGKGSTSHMIASVLQSAGYKVGLYTSPHLYDFRERIRINGEMIPEQEVVDFVKHHKLIMEKLKPSFFEMTAALAFDYFACQQVDIAVIEAGMGGRLDSTNIITPLLSIITNIGLDHTEFLGDTLAKIAEEKAGIIKSGIPVLIGEWNAESAIVFIHKAEENNSSIIFADKVLQVNKTCIKNSKQKFSISAVNPAEFPYPPINIEIDLLGSYQAKNILTVLLAVEILRKYTTLIVSNKSLSKSLSNAAKQTGLWGRWQILQNKPLIVCDTGHNAHGMSYVMKQLKQLSHKNLYIVLGLVSDKDVESILPLLPADAYYFFTKANLPRAMDAQALAEKCKYAGLKGETVTGVYNALQAAKNKAGADDVIFVGGSTFVVAEITPG
ncbi:MAG: bifunctional folylpolyglutamate synthase/dihydrofolate synthase [Prevotellaceae bacterium]|jgi:dihydrofolate synthase/folylpolyglutamate synthase|nr:bifunctional folylpolyglutamate synthase/dihydrofolate synthase [Prevotellaceae bacterium]